jgi:hypothetical protein
VIDGIPFSALSASALLGITILLLLTGRLVPRSVLKDKTDEAERWRLAYESERTARGISDAQTNELLEVARTTQAIIAAMNTTSTRIRETGSSDAPAET